MKTRDDAHADPSCQAPECPGASLLDRQAGEHLCSSGGNTLLDGREGLLYAREVPGHPVLPLCDDPDGLEIRAHHLPRERRFGDTGRCRISHLRQEGVIRHLRHGEHPVGGLEEEPELVIVSSEDQSRGEAGG